MADLRAVNRPAEFGALENRQIIAARGQRSASGQWIAARWETESFLRRAEAFHDYTTDDLERDIAAIRDASRE